MGGVKIVNELETPVLVDVLYGDFMDTSDDATAPRRKWDYRNGKPSVAEPSEFLEGGQERYFNSGAWMWGWWDSSSVTVRIQRPDSPSFEEYTIGLVNSWRKCRDVVLMRDGCVVERVEGEIVKQLRGPTLVPGGHDKRESPIRKRVAGKLKKPIGKGDYLLEDLHILPAGSGLYHAVIYVGGDMVVEVNRDTMRNAAKHYQKIADENEPAIKTVEKCTGAEGETVGDRSDDVGTSNEELRKLFPVTAAGVVSLFGFYMVLRRGGAMAYSFGIDLRHLDENIVEVHAVPADGERDAVVGRALGKVGFKWNYDLVKNNCQHFAQWCQDEKYKSFQTDPVNSKEYNKEEYSVVPVLGDMFGVGKKSRYKLSLG